MVVESLVREVEPERRTSKPPFLPATEICSPLPNPPPMMVTEALPAVISADPVAGPEASKTVSPPILVVPSSPSAPASPYGPTDP